MPSHPTLVCASALWEMLFWCLCKHTARSTWERATWSCCLIFRQGKIQTSLASDSSFKAGQAAFDVAVTAWWDFGSFLSMDMLVWGCFCFLPQERLISKRIQPGLSTLAICSPRFTLWYSDWQKGSGFLYWDGSSDRHYLTQSNLSCLSKDWLEQWSLAITFHPWDLRGQSTGRVCRALLLHLWEVPRTTPQKLCRPRCPDMHPELFKAPFLFIFLPPNPNIYRHCYFSSKMSLGSGHQWHGVQWPRVEHRA